MRDGASVTAVDDNLTNWDPHFNQQIDGMVLIGDNERRLVQFKRDEVAALLKEGGATILVEQIGSALKNHVNDGIEHFGYVDGRSQPLLLAEDIEREAKTAGSVRWDPEFSLGAALLKDPSTTDTVSFGSYFIFRKLEQNVQGFKRQEQVLATKLGFADREKRELAGALVVGRFEDGTPVTLSNETKSANPPNDFNYDNDTPASRCPFHAHIRKVNPRHPVASERAHIMPRRGIPFTDVPRNVHPSDLPGSTDLGDFDTNVKPDLPPGGVGLLFMAYNSSLTNQFVFTQHTWADNKDFPNAGVGADPVIGQGPGTTVLQTWPSKWDDPAGGTQALNFSNFVTMRGGEYFFAPSLTFFKNL
jgi:Dyp-type peroxidase family